MIASSYFILCVLFFLGEAHSLFLTVCITLLYLQTLLLLLRRPITRLHALCLLLACLSTNQLATPLSVSICSIQRPEAAFFGAWLCNCSPIPQAAERPPLGQQPALHTLVSKHLLPAAWRDLGHLSHVFVLLDLVNSPVAALLRQDLLSALRNPTLGQVRHLRLIFKLLLPVGFILATPESSVLTYQSQLLSPSHLRF